MNGDEMTMEIAAAHPDDVPEVLRVVRACAARMLSMGIDQWDEVYPDAAMLTADAAAGNLFVIREIGKNGERGACLGLITLDENQDPAYADVAWEYAGARILVVHRLSVDPAAQGRGLAKRLMAFAEDKASKEGYEVIRLDAFTQNPAAQGLYAKRGYRQAGTVRLRKGLFTCFEKQLALECSANAGL